LLLNPTAHKRTKPTMPNFGAIKMVMARCPGAPRPVCKKALEDNNDDIDAAAKHINDTTEFKDINPPAEKTGGGGGNLSYEDHLAGRPCIEVVAQNTVVSTIKIEEGDNKTYPSYGDTLRVHYTGKLEDGTVFDSSRARGTPFGFKLGKKEVIAGWDEAIAKMSLGEVSLLMIPAAKAYGEAGSQDGSVPPNADLKFEVQLLDIRRQTSCLGAGRHGGVQKDAHEYTELANQLLGRAPPTSVEHRLPDDRQPMPLTSDMPKVDMLREHS
jgi:FK506-binding protein 1